MTKMKIKKISSLAIIFVAIWLAQSSFAYSEISGTISAGKELSVVEKTAKTAPNLKEASGQNSSKINYFAIILLSAIIIWEVRHLEKISAQKKKIAQGQTVT